MRQLNQFSHAHTNSNQFGINKPFLNDKAKRIVYLSSEYIYEGNAVGDL